MTEHNDIELADLYVRNKLTAEEETAFEVRMLESSELQQHVQTALAIKESYKLDEILNGSPLEAGQGESEEKGSSWRPMALAASVLLAVVSTVMWAKTSIDSNQLKLQVAKLSQPQTSVLRVPVNIMRSAGSATPDVIIQKPPDGSVIQLSIELSTQSSAQPTLRFTLVNDAQESILSWQASPAGNHYSTVLLQSEQVPTGLLQLQVSSLDGNILDRHLLEFRPPAD